jgi:hypothetical protein
MVEFELDLEIKRNDYPYLWIKYVAGFDPSQHCAKCLTGYWSKAIPFVKDKAGIRRRRNLDEYDTPFVYLCGVHKSFQLVNNLHFPMRRKPGELFTFENEAIRFTVRDHEVLPIPPLPEEARRRLTPVYYTCRNFQFGWHYLKDPRVDPLAPYDELERRKQRLGLLDPPDDGDPGPVDPANPNDVPEWVAMRDRLRARDSL